MLEREKESRKIVFFDGVCHLCNSFVDFAIQNEKAAKKSLFFAPLQGEIALRLLPRSDREDLQSIVYWDGGKLHRRSNAVLHIFSELDFPWGWLSRLGFCVPAFLRDAIYRTVAKNRYRWFGKREHCRLPQPGEKSQLLV